jgi:monoamine oxidase
MAKTVLFGRLQRVATRASTKKGGKRPSRREIMQGISILATFPALSVCDGEPQTSDERVAVIGAGIAGAHCAWRLRKAGVTVTLYEASARSGGRIFTGRELFDQNQTCELGGELIDSNHRFMWALADEFNLTLHDRFSAEAKDLIRDTWVVGGQIVPEDEIVRQFALVVDEIKDALEAADSDDEAFYALDNTSLAAWLAEVVPASTYPELHALLGVAYLGEFGLELEEQSALNLIYLIGLDDAETFQIFGESDERYHLRGGNDQLTTKLAEELGDAIQLDHVLRSARRTTEGFLLEFYTPAGTHKVECDRVVFALPFTKLREVDLSGLDLSVEKLTMIEELGYGTNAKVMGAFTSRVWANQGFSGSATTDLRVQQTWDSSVGQAGEQGILTNFSGGKQGVASGEGTPEAWFENLLDDIDAVYPGAKVAYVPDSAVRMHWPTHPFTLGSYSCYRPGQWSFWGTEGLAENNVHFCGEHTSPEFQGWMEGAAETGARVAAEILDALGIPLDTALRDLLDEDALLPGQTLKSLRFPKRLTRVRESRSSGAN